jgi:hypothetical protein
MRIETLHTPVSCAVDADGGPPGGTCEKGGTMKKASAIVVLALVGVLAAATVGAWAQPGAQVRRPQSSSPARQQTQEERAKRITERIELIIARFNNNKERHIATYNAVKDKLQAAIAKLEANGYDVSKLKADLQTLDGMVVKFGQDYAAMIDLLRAAEQYAPYESQGQFLQAIQQARARMKVVRQDILDVRNYYQTVMRHDIQSVRSQKPQSSGPASSVP